MAIGLKDRELQDYYESLLDMCSSKGWKNFLSDVDRLRLAAENVRTLKPNETINFRQGQLDILDWLVSRAEAYGVAYETLLVEEDNADNA